MELPDAEKAVIRDVIGMIRGLKQSPSWQVARAARKWESGIVCFIKFRLIRRASLTGERMKPGVSPARG